MRQLLAFTMIAAVGATVYSEENQIVTANAKLEKLWGDGSFTEGPAYGPDRCIYFTDIGNRIMRFDPRTGKTNVFREPSGRANGLDFDVQGRLVACEGSNTGGNRRVTRTDANGKVHVLSDNWNGKRLNSPNDLTIARDGTIYFSDPRYVGSEPREIDRENVYRISPTGNTEAFLTNLAKPNGVVLSPNMKTLYVANSDPGKGQQLWAYPIGADGKPGMRNLLHDFGKRRGIDGMCCDADGNVYGAAGSGDDGGVYVFSPAGRKLAFIPVPESPTNCVFGGKDRNVLYVTAGKSLYRIQLQVRGFAVYWPTED
jgi:gluconolactonase